MKSDVGVDESARKNNPVVIFRQLNRSRSDRVGREKGEKKKRDPRWA